MSNINIVEDGVIIHLVCNDCLSYAFNFQFVAEDDTVTIGWISAIQCNVKNTMIVRLTPFDWNALNNGEKNLVEKKIEQITNKKWHILKLEKIISKSGKGVGFQEYIKSYKKNIVKYKCPCCDEGFLIQESEMNVDEYKEIGGHFYVLPSLS